MQYAIAYRFIPGEIYHFFKKNICLGNIDLILKWSYLALIDNLCTNQPVALPDFQQLLHRK